MSLLDPATIPGYIAAVEQEKSDRDLAFVGYDVPLCGMPARQLSLRRLLLLTNCGNAFVCGGIVEPKDVAMFLWFVSPEYCQDKKRRDAFVKRAARLEMLASVEEIQAYLARTFADCPPEIARTKAYYSSAAEIVGLIAREFGWDDEAILNKPLARLFQYLREIVHRRRPDVPQFNRSDALISRWLAARNGGGYGV